MKKINLLLYAILLMVLAFPQSLHAEIFSAVAPTGQTLYYYIVPGGVNVTCPGTSSPYWNGYTKPTGALTIPSTVTHDSTTYNVIAIGNQAFRYCSGLTSVSIPNSVTSIGYNAFYDCSSLTSVSIPSSVNFIGDEAFYGCSDLTSVTIPDGVTSIGYGTFWDCERLTSVTIPNSVTSIGSSAFTLCISLTSITIPSTVTSIGSQAFYDCRRLTSVTIPNSVTSIGFMAYYRVRHIMYHGSATGSPWGATSMNGVIDSNLVFSDSSRTNLLAYIGNGGAVTIPSSVTSIGQHAFYYSTGLTSVNIPSSVTSIGGHAFAGCSGLSSIIVDSANTMYDSRGNCNAIIRTSSNTLITGCQNTVIPNSVTVIGQAAFLDCSGLTSISIPSSVTSIGNYAFDSCSGLNSITIGSGVTSIGHRAFKYCTSLSSVTIPTSVTFIGDEAFGYDINLTSIILLNPSMSSDNVWYGSFYGVYPNVTLIVPCNSVSYYSSAWVWSNFNNIVERPDCGDPYYDFDATSFGNKLYYKILDSTRVMVVHPLECDSVGNSFWTGYLQPTGSLIIPDSVEHNNVVYQVTKVGDEAFMNCTAIRSVSIPVSVDSIGRKAFAFDYRIDDISWGVSVVYIGDSAFFGIGRVEITIVTYPGYTGPTPTTSGWIGGGAFSGCSFGSFTYSGSAIGSGSYSGNSGLQNFYYSGSLSSIGDSAFEGCGDMSVFTQIGGIPEVRIPRPMQSIGNAAFGNCIAITRVRYEADSCTRMGSDTLPVFMNDVNISSLIIGEYVRWIPSYAFLGCTGIDSISSYSMIAPILGVDVFSDIPASIPIYIPCGSLASYTSRWPHFTNFIEMYDGTLTALSSDTTKGTVVVETQPSCSASGVAVATPKFGYHFVRWNDGDTTNPRSISVPEGTMVTITAYFEINEYSLSIVCDSTLGTVSGNGQYLHGDMATVSVTPNYGYVFNHWAGIPNQSSPIDSTDMEASFVMLGDVELTALFDTMHFNLTITSNNPDWGLVEGGGEYAYGTSATLNATANEGFRFVGWSDGNEENPRTVVVTEDVELTANFAEWTSISDVTNNIISVTPNPTAGQLIIGAEGIETIVVYDLGGRKVLQFENTNTINLANLSSGTYFLHISSSQGFVVAKVLKQ